MISLWNWISISVGALYLIPPLLYYITENTYHIRALLGVICTAIISETIKYFQTIIDEVKPAKGVFIALDGVVPFAKILQQRRRRFKSIQIKIAVCITT